MTINLNQDISVECDQASLSRAIEAFNDLRAKPGYEPVIDALFVLLAFRQLEKAKPGSLAKINETIGAAAKKGAS